MTAMCRWFAGETSRHQGHRLDLRQPDPIRHPRRFQFIPAHLEGRCRKARSRGCRPDLESRRQDHVPAGLCHQNPDRGTGHAGLEDRIRPHFFGGSPPWSQAVHAVPPDFAVFGEKDFQPLRVVTRMARRSRPRGQGDRLANRARTRRLAMSSRNVYLSPDSAPDSAGTVPRDEGKRRRLRAGDDLQAAMAGGAELITQGRFRPRLFRGQERRHPSPIASAKDGPVRILVAARIGTTRLDR